MPACLKQAKLTAIPMQWRQCLLLLSLLFIHSVTYAEFTIQHAETRLEDGVYLLDASLDYGLTDAVVEALQNGVTLTLLLSIDIKRERWYLWDESVTELKQQYQLKYFALSKKYVLNLTNTGIQEIHTSLDSVLMSLNYLEDFPLLDAALVSSDSDYIVYLKIQLDIEALPAPLRPVAYFSSDWRLASDWFTCHLQKNLLSESG
ncbi:DUF4390 domain-containing protein [Candidatus Albibeggiatoa sp. nov. NOAA]|uniref:DUF4390 domain-containing protein n=1 Tax=Candidatus Albibeggiatoa sp. nov. NOAA TaxID=3162724 RepID=UPI0032F72883|nr:DUF4390 domain-containing protein [Thiotrichaceae bacterium]